MRKYTLLLFVILIAGGIIDAQENERVKLGVNVGVNISGIDYGIAIATNFLPGDDYRFVRGNGSDNYGYYLGLGISLNLLDRLDLFSNAGFVYTSYLVNGNVTDLRPLVTRPLSSDIPINYDGVLRNYFVGLEGGLKYLLFGTSQEGFFITSKLDYLIRLNTSLDIDVTYEDLSEGKEDDISAVHDIAFNNLLFFGFELGYRHQIKEALTIEGKLGINLGLNEYEEYKSKPMIWNFGIAILKSFK